MALVSDPFRLEEREEERKQRRLEERKQSNLMFTQSTSTPTVPQIEASVTNAMTSAFQTSMATALTSAFTQFHKLLRNDSVHTPTATFIVWHTFCHFLATDFVMRSLTNFTQIVCSTILLFLNLFCFTPRIVHVFFSHKKIFCVISGAYDHYLVCTLMYATLEVLSLSWQS